MLVLTGLEGQHVWSRRFQEFDRDSGEFKIAEVFDSQSDSMTAVEWREVIRTHNIIIGTPEAFDKVVLDHMVTSAWRSLAWSSSMKFIMP